MMYEIMNITPTQKRKKDRFFIIIYVIKLGVFRTKNNAPGPLPNNLGGGGALVLPKSSIVAFLYSF